MILKLGSSCVLDLVLNTILIYVDGNGQFRMLYDEAFDVFYRSPDTGRKVKSRRLLWVGHVARMGKQGVHTEFW
jgi:hypothetical protein